MIVTNLRSSSVNTYKYCPMSYFLEYNLGWDSGINKAAIKGTIVHHVLEILALLKKADQNGNGSIKILEKELLRDDYLETDKNIEKLTDWLYDIHFERYNNKGLVWKDADRQDCRKWVQKTLTQWNQQFDPRIRHIIDAEKFFEFEILKPWASYCYELADGSKLQGCLKLFGTIDLVTQLENEYYEMIDWKTGKNRDWNKGTDKTAEDVKNDIQPRMYHYVMSQQYPATRITITLLHINDGGPISIYFDESDVAQTEKLIQHYFETIKTSQPICNKSWRCSKWCEFGKTTFENTSITPLIRNTPLTKCQQTEYVLQFKDMNTVVANMCNGSFLDNLKAYHQG